MISGHTSYINDITFDPDNVYLASASDDNTVKIWFTEKFNLKTTLNLTSPAMVVAWHRGDPGKLMVAEKIGKFPQLCTNSFTTNTLVLRAGQVLQRGNRNPDSLPRLCQVVVFCPLGPFRESNFGHLAVGGVAVVGPYQALVSSRIKYFFLVFECIGFTEFKINKTKYEKRTA